MSYTRGLVILCSPLQHAGVTCAQLKTPENGIQEGTCDPGAIGESCRFSCNFGFRLSGNGILTCLESGRWNSSPPTCYRVECPALSPPANGVLTGYCQPGEWGRTCQVACNPGFALQSNASTSFVCTAAGTWSPSLPAPACQRVTCPTLVPPNGATLSGTCQPGFPGLICTLSCRSGTTLQGQGAVLCQTSGQWSGSLGTCREGGNESGNNVRCPSVPVPQGGSLLTCTDGNHVGSTCQVLCNRGLFTFGDSVRNCLLTGQWSGSDTVCRAKYNKVGTKFGVLPLWMLLMG